MSFGDQSNVWDRSMMHPQSNFQGPPQQMFMQTQSNMAVHGGGGGMYPNFGGGGGGENIQYPRTGLNPVAFQGSGGGGMGGGAPGMPQHYNYVGTVTKINNDCGLVNNEVFFYRNVCKGPEPKLGDRVIFEATYSTSGQFKWNATRIQLMQTKPAPIMNTSKANYGSPVPIQNDYQRGGGGGHIQRHSSPKRGSPPIRGDRHERGDRRDRERERERHHRSRDRNEDDHERKRRREDRSRDHDANNVHAAARSDRERDRARETRRDRAISEREREREREKDKDKERKEHEKTRDAESHRSAVSKSSASGGGSRKARAIRRYMVQIPKSVLALKNADVQELRNRYTGLYIPSDFFHANMKWTESFTPENPFSLRRPCRFHIMHKLVDPPFEQSLDELEPEDADYVYSAKVMLLSLPPLAEIYNKCFESNEDELDQQAVHLSRLINFLVGVRGRNEPMAIGGPWSPSLDGENPDTDPSVLIRTAIRTCKALTGIDLSNCTQWYRFVELYYHRTEYKNMENDAPPRVETVVIYLPDVHSCMPTLTEYETLSGLYRSTAENIIARRTAAFNKNAIAAANTDDNNESNANAETENGEGNNTSAEQNDDEGDGDADGTNVAADENDDNNEAVGEEGDEDNENGDEEETEEQMDMDHSGDAANEEADDNDMGQNADHAPDAADENEEPTPEPTHYTMLDLKSMKVQEIRDELLARDLSDKGVRNIVVARLAKALSTEKAEEKKAKNRERLMKKKQKRNAVKTSDDKDDPSSAKGNKSSEKLDDSKDDWADAIDFELSDIVILDEYDASKNPEDKELTEKEKSQIVRRCTLPPGPQIVVHPNKLAKGGNFDCALMSLSVLLDYHPEDTKERFFEVSLFAEIFNEMLMRDFAFNIYKEIYLHNEKLQNSDDNADGGGEAKSETEKTPETNGSGEEKVTKDAAPIDESKIRKRRMSTVDGREQDNGGDRKAPPPKRRMSTIDGRDALLSSEDNKVAKPQRRMSIADRRESDIANETSSKKMVVVKPHLRLSFLYFDTTQCGYIFERDLEDLFAVLGLNLSRSQIKKVLGKLGTRLSIHYRKLTDREELQEAPPSIEDADDLPLEEMRDIASGNNKYEFVFGESHTTHCVVPLDGGENNDADLINYNGTVIHVGKLMEQIKRTEKNFSDLEKLYNDLLKQHSDLQKEHSKSSSKIKDLQSDTKSLSRKLTDTNQDLYSLNRKYRDQNATLSYIYTRIAPYFREKEKEKDSKSESSHKDKDEKKKDEDKPKDKESAEKHKEKGKDKENDKEKVKGGAEKEKYKETEKEKSKETEKEKSKENEKEKSKETQKGKSKEVEETEEEKSKETPKEKPNVIEKEKEKSKESEQEENETSMEVDAEQVTEKETCERKEAKTEIETTKNEVVEKKESTAATTTKATEVKESSEVKVSKPKTTETSKPAQSTPTTTVTATTKAAPAKVAPPKAAITSTPAKPGTTVKPGTTPAKTPAKAPAKATPAKATPVKTVNAPGAGKTASTPAKATPAKQPAGKVNPNTKKATAGAAAVKKVASSENSQK